LWWPAAPTILVFEVNNEFVMCAFVLGRPQGQTVGAFLLKTDQRRKTDLTRTNIYIYIWQRPINS